MTQEQTTAIVKAKPQDTVRAALERMKPQMAMALPKHITPERMLRVVMTAVQNVPKLLECEKTSLYSAVMTCCQLGLEPDGVLGQAYLIPFGKRVQFIVGYKGLIDLARRSGDVMNILAKEVHANDLFDVDFSKDIPFTHKPLLSGDRGAVTHFWALARFKDGGFHWDYMSVEEVLAIRDKSQGWQSAKKFNSTANSPWEAHFVEMGKKTIIRRIAKYLPMSVQKASAIESAYDDGRMASTDDHGDIVIEPQQAIEAEETVDTETGEVAEQPKQTTDDQMAAFEA